MSDDTQPFLYMAIKWVVILFAIVGFLSTLGILDSINKQNLLYGKSAISENVTVSGVITSRDGYYTHSFVATNGKGYTVDSGFTFAHVDNIVIGHTYSIRYFCNPLANNERTVMEMVDLEPDVYTCVTVNGVCS